MTAIILYILLIVCILLVGIILIKWLQLIKGRKKSYQRIDESNVDLLSDLGTVKKLTILPLVEYYATDNSLKTEPGISYLIKADDTTILMDTGFNKKKEHPSPLIQNMKTLGVSADELDSIFISHLHLDHVGGMQEQKNKQFSLTQGFLQLPEIPVYSPAHVSPSKWNPGSKTEVIQKPQKLKKGIASIGVLPRYLFLMGNTLEHCLAIHVENKGIVLVVGCGHPTIEVIIERTKKIFKEPIYAIVGGLHFPVRNGRVMLGPINLQNVVGSDRMPWQGINEKDVKNAIAAIQGVDPQYIALSPHDSSDWSIEQFKKTFKEKYQDIMVGKMLEF